MVTRKIVAARLFSVCLALSLAPAVSGEWRQYKLAPFEVLADDNDEERAREVLNHVVQLRHSLGWQLGNPEFEPVWPLRIIVAGKRDAIFPEPALARDAYLMSIRSIDLQARSSTVSFLLGGWPGQLPPDLVRGLIQLYSTLEVEGTRVTLGKAPAQKDRDWARAHMLAVHPDYSGKLRVLLGNLTRGVEPDVAYRNAFTKSAEELERALDQYIEAGQYGTIPAPSRPLNARRELIGRPIEDAVAKLAVADLLFAHNQPGAKAAYQALNHPEGIGLIDRNAEQLRTAESARALVEYARLTTDKEAKRGALTKAAAANKRWAEPWKILAPLETHPAQQLPVLRKVTELEPHVAANWIELATMQEEVKQYAEAAKSWAMAERSTLDVSERARIVQSRLAGQTKRIEAQIAAREEARRLAEAEIQAVREKALLAIRAAEAKANAGKPVIDPSSLGEYSEGASGQKKVSGTLVRVECLGTAAHLYIASGRQTVRIRVADSGQVELAGGGQTALTCGAQRAGRKIAVEYTPSNDPLTGLAGDAVRVELSR